MIRRKQLCFCFSRWSEAEENEMKIKAIKMVGVTEKWQLFSFISYEQSLFHLSPKGTTNKSTNCQQGQQILYVNIQFLNLKIKGKYE
jgi:hypothetical protein